MNQPLRARWIAPLAALAAIALILAWWQPWRILTSPTPPATPRATRTAQAPTTTRAPERIALPTERPTLSPTVRVATPATPARTTVAAPTGNHPLFYIGTLNGESGVIAARADGSAPRLLIPGPYDQIAFAPDGTRFAVVGTILGGGGAQQVALFTPDGRALARYNFGVGTSHPIAWSPSGKYLLHTILVDGNPQTRVLSDGEVRQITPPASNASFPYGWTPNDRIVYFSHENSSQSRPLSLWTVDAAGGDPQKHLADNFVPVGASADGAHFYILRPGDEIDPTSPLTQLMAIDMRWGNATQVIDANQLAGYLLGLDTTEVSYRVDFAILSPDGTTFALGLFPSSRPGTPVPRAETHPGFVVFVQTSGRVSGAVRVATNSQSGPSGWSPDGSRFAHFTFGDQSPDGQAQVFDQFGNSTTFSVERPSRGNLPTIAWSPGGGHLIYTSPRGLMLIAFDPHRSQLIAPGATAPAWQPR